MSLEVVLFTGDVGIPADKVEILDSDEVLVVVKAWFRKPEPIEVTDDPLPFAPSPPPEVEDPGPPGEQIDVTELPDLRVLVDA